MKPTIFTYHEFIPTWSHGQLVQHWKRNWQRHGFRSIVIGRDAAKRHPMFGAFMEKIRQLPTINDRRYEEACYIRWLAFDVMLAVTDGRAIMADYDVMNLNFNARHFGRDPVICHERTRVPCMVEANHEGARMIIDLIMSRQTTENHYSDMYAFKESDWPITGYCLELGEPRWQEALAVHAASGAIQRTSPGADKQKFIIDRFK